MKKSGTNLRSDKPDTTNEPLGEFITIAEAVKRFTIGRPAIYNNIDARKIRTGPKRGMIHTEDLIAVVEAANEKKAAMASSGASRDQKLELECQLLTERIKVAKEQVEQSKLETARQKLESVSTREVQEFHDRLLAACKGQCDSWLTERTSHAKSVKEKQSLEALAASFLNAMADRLDEWQNNLV